MVEDFFCVSTSLEHFVAGISDIFILSVLLKAIKFGSGVHLFTSLSIFTPSPKMLYSKKRVKKKMKLRLLQLLGK